MNIEEILHEASAIGMRLDVIALARNIAYKIGKEIPEPEHYSSAYLTIYSEYTRRK